MSYIKVKFPDGVERGLKYNNLGVKEFINNVDWNRFNETANYAMVWGGLVGNAYAKREEMDLTFEEVIDLCDKMEQKTFDQISLVIAEVEVYKKAFPAAEEAKETTDEKKSESVTNLQTA